jgi:predicted lipid-binding transport protein (Tim44 family)
MKLQADVARPATAHGGFVLGELFVAILLLALAISSVSALMYTVTRPPRIATAVECVDKASARTDKCLAAMAAASKTAAPKSAGSAKLLVAGCATRSGARVQACKDSVAEANAGEATTIRSRTDSASLQLLPKKPKRAPRPDLGFVR